MEFIGIHEVRRRVNLSRSSIWRLERAGTFPSRRRLSANRVAWLREEIDAWMSNRAAASPALTAG
jgi:predicted DNA-binding transcriptional regulator AlpA